MKMRAVCPETLHLIPKPAVKQVSPGKRSGGREEGREATPSSGRAQRGDLWQASSPSACLPAQAVCSGSATAISISRRKSETNSSIPRLQRWEHSPAPLRSPSDRGAAPRRTSPAMLGAGHTPRASPAPRQWGKAPGSGRERNRGAGRGRSGERRRAEGSAR